MNMRFFIFFIFVSVFLTSCKSTQKLNQTTFQNNNATPSNQTAKSAIDSSFTLFIQNNSWFSARATLLLANTNDELSLFMVNKRDSALYLNINKFGIEIARAVFTPDSISMVNRFEKTYYQGDYSILMKLYGFSLTFNMIQAIILGESFKDLVPTSQQILQTDSVITIFSPRSVDVNAKIAIHQIVVFDKLNQCMLSNKVKDINSQQSFSVTYSNHQIIDNYKFPQNYSIELPNLAIQISSKNLKVNVPGPTILSIPTKYTLMFP